MMKNSYMLFQAEGLNFLVSIDQIELVKSGMQGSEDFPVYDFGFITGLRDTRKKAPYLLVFNSGKESFAISVDYVDEMVEISEEDCIKLDYPVRWSGNEYLDKVTCLRDKTPTIAYVLDVSNIHTD